MARQLGQSTNQLRVLSHVAPQQLAQAGTSKAEGLVMQRRMIDRYSGTGLFGAGLSQRAADDLPRHAHERQPLRDPRARAVRDRGRAGHPRAARWRWRCCRCARVSPATKRRNAPSMHAARSASSRSGRSPSAASTCSPRTSAWCCSPARTSTCSLRRRTATRSRAECCC